MAKILVVDDEQTLNEILSRYLAKEGYTCISAFDGFEALNFISEDRFDLIVLDVMMPGINGFEVLKQLRRTQDTPVIMLTAKNMEEDIVEGFRHGADDYVTKPFSNKELIMRIKAILKRRLSHQDLLVYKDLKLDCKGMKLYKSGGEIPLTAHEYAIMEVFFRHMGQVLTRQQIIDLAMTESEGYDRIIDSAIKRLRQKIEIDSKKPVYIVTKYGVGYRFGG